MINDCYYKVIQANDACRIHDSLDTRKIFYQWCQNYYCLTKFEIINNLIESQNRATKNEIMKDVVFADYHEGKIYIIQLIESLEKSFNLSSPSLIFRLIAEYIDKNADLETIIDLFFFGDWSQYLCIQESEIFVLDCIEKLLALSVLNNSDELNEIFFHLEIFPIVNDGLECDSYLIKERKWKIMAYSIILSNQQKLQFYANIDLIDAICRNTLHEISLVALLKLIIFDPSLCSSLDHDYLNIVINENPKFIYLGNILLNKMQELSLQ